MEKINVLIFPSDARPEFTPYVAAMGFMKLTKVSGAYFASSKDGGLHQYIHTQRHRIIIIDGLGYKSYMLSAIEDIQRWIARYDMDTVMYFLGKENIPGITPIDTLDEIKDVVTELTEYRAGP